MATARKKKTTADPIERLRQLCLALPEVEEKPFGGHTAPAWRRTAPKGVVTQWEAAT